MTTRKVSFACGMALVAAGAITQEVKAAEGFYVGVHGGAVFLRDGRFHDLSTSTSNGTTSITASLTDIKQKFDTGAGIGAHAGYGFANGFRVEGETTYRRNTLGDLAFKAKVTTTTSTGTTATATSVSLRADVETDIHSWAFMVNGFYDIDLGMPFTPYIGAGIGPAIVTLHLFGEEDSDTV